MQRAFAKCHTDRAWLREFLAELLGTFILVVSISYHAIQIISKLIINSDRFGEILQNWQKLKEKIHTTKDR
jgi:hypothetical protein